MLHRHRAFVAPLILVFAACSPDGVSAPAEPLRMPGLQVSGLSSPVDPVNASQSPISASLSASLWGSGGGHNGPYTYTATASGAPSGVYTYHILISECVVEDGDCTYGQFWDAEQFDATSPATFYIEGGSEVAYFTTKVIVHEAGSPNYYTQTSNAVWRRGPGFGLLGDGSGGAPGGSCSYGGYPLREYNPTTQQWKNYERNVCTGAKVYEP